MTRLCDLYCSNPDCNCKEVHLQFLKVVPELSGNPGIIDCFMAEMNLVHAAAERSIRNAVAPDEENV